MDTKVVLVTGGSSGIGKSICEFLKEKGYTVYGTSRSADSFKNCAYHMVQLDVNDESSVKNGVQEVIAREGRIDVLINNAGIGITGPVEETPIAEMRRAFDTNFYGPISVSAAVIPYMRDRASGLILNITSIAGYMGLPFRGVYSATKGALELVSEALRLEVREFGIKVVCLAPGDYATNIASGRFHSPVNNGSPYERSYGKTLDLINEHVDDGNDPIEVALAVYKILKKSEPSVHYRVGDFMQKFSITLKKLLPDKMYEALLRNHYKL